MCKTIILFFLFLILIINKIGYAKIPDEEYIKEELRQIQNNKNIHDKEIFIKVLMSTMNSINEFKLSQKKIYEYNKEINNFPNLIYKLHREISQESENIKDDFISDSNLNQYLLKINANLVYLDNKLQNEIARNLNNYISNIYQQQLETFKKLNHIEQKLQSFLPYTKLDRIRYNELRAKQAALKLKIEELSLAQLNNNNLQELSRLRIELLRTRYDNVNRKLQLLRNNLNIITQKESETVNLHTEILIGQFGILPELINNQLKINRELSIQLKQQSNKMNLITSHQRHVISQIIKVKKILINLREQVQWLNKSPALGEILRAQLHKLPGIPKSQQLDSDMAQLRIQRLYFEELIQKLIKLSEKIKYDDLSINREYKDILNIQINNQRNLLNFLITGCDTQILELTKIKVDQFQLEKIIKEIKDTAHRHLFWVADINPIDFSFLIHVGKDINRLLNFDVFSQILCAFGIIFKNRNIFILLLFALLLIGFNLSSRKHYYMFLENSSKKIGKVNHDRFSITLISFLWSLLMSSSAPIFWITLGYGLKCTWNYPAAVAIGHGIISTTPMLWIFISCSYFSLPKGLFIAHFFWSEKKVKLSLRYYIFYIGIIVPLTMSLIFFNNYREGEFISTLGRVCFILICIFLALMTGNLKQAGLPLYLDKNGNSNNIINNSLWNFIICSPIIASISSCIGHLSASQTLLVRLETSVFIWFVLLVIYHIIRRWMFIQRRRIDFERAKQRRNEILAQRNRINNEEDIFHLSTDESHEIDDNLINLDVISAQSLRLIRSILTLIALLSLILLWSELHPAFAFLDNIILWNITYIIKGTEDIESITLRSIFILILILIITTQMVRNFPALLELALIQHLDLTPGTGYAIITMTRYSIILLGTLIGFYVIGIEWSKLQWLIAALGVGLGFGLQEIFANFISGLIILFEKPIRIGDTITIRNFTGSITKINTRATTISDWDKKEVIVPNKAFITEQLVNWSLSDTITRVVLNVPAPSYVKIEKITDILVSSATSCSLVLKSPSPEVFLVELKQGILIFELRLYALEISHRMLLKHQVHSIILKKYKENNIELPCIPIIIKSEKEIFKK